MPTAMRNIKKSSFEPISIEVEGDRIYTTVPLSPLLFKKIYALEEECKKGTLGVLDSLVQAFMLIFDLPMDEAEELDIRLMKQLVDCVVSEAVKRMTASSFPETYPGEAHGKSKNN